MISKAHPAFTLKLRNEDETISLDIDLVPCFQFKEDKWPTIGYRENPFPETRVSNSNSHYKIGKWCERDLQNNTFWSYNVQYIFFLTMIQTQFLFHFYTFICHLRG